MLPTSTVCSPAAYNAIVAYTIAPACVDVLELCPPGDIYDRMRTALATRLDPVRLSVDEKLASYIR
jgi:hypothetical protein